MKRTDWLAALGLALLGASMLPLWQDPALAAAAFALLALCG